MSDPVAWATGVPGPLCETTIWRVDLGLSETARAACLAALSDEEAQRAARFRRQEDRDRYAASHAALRLVLGRALRSEPAVLRFRADAAGKPELDGPWRERIAFNLSHSGRVGLIGLSRGPRIGVDVEVMRPIADCLSLARSHFSPHEVAGLSRLPPDALEAAFYACWTRKEAFVKALGLGLSFPLGRFTVAVPPEPVALRAIDGSEAAARAWSLHHLVPAPGHVGAFAIEEPDAAFVLRSLDPGWVAART